MKLKIKSHTKLDGIFTKKVPYFEKETPKSKFPNYRTFGLKEMKWNAKIIKPAIIM